MRRCHRDAVGPSSAAKWLTSGTVTPVGLVRRLNRLDERVLGPPRPRVLRPLRPGPLRLAKAGAAIAVLAGLALS